MDSNVLPVVVVGSTDFGLDTCRWCLRTEHARCHGHPHERYDGNGCLCTVCHPDRRRTVLQDRKRSKRSRVGGASTTSPRDPLGSVRSQPGLWRDATGMSRLPASERKYGSNVRKGAGRPQVPLFDPIQLQSHRAVWGQVAVPARWDKQSWDVISTWRSQGLSWAQIEQVTERRHVRQAWAAFTASGVFASIRP